MRLTRGLAAGRLRADELTSLAWIAAMTAVLSVVTIRWLRARLVG